MDTRKILIAIREAETSDLEKILEIQSRGYEANYRESKQIFEKMILAYPLGCIVVQDGKESILGYLFAHPSYQNKLQELDSSQIEIPKDPNCFYFHDLCVHPNSRGQGIANLLIERGIKIAQRNNLAKITCVAVNESHKFWNNHGFRIEKELEYGGKIAYYMEMDISPNGDR